MSAPLKQKIMPTRSAEPSAESRYAPNPAALPPGPQRTNAKSGEVLHRARALSAPQGTARKARGRIGSILAKSLARKWQEHCQHWECCQKHCSEESVHELRVTTRRLMAHLALIQQLVPGKAVPKIRCMLKDRLSSLGDVRDIHVQRMAVRKLCRRFDELSAWHKFLKKREKKLVAKAGKKVAGWKEKKLLRLLDQVEARAARHPGDEGTQQRLVDQAIQSAFDEACTRLGTVKQGQPRTIHRLRIAFKEFRYRLEGISPALTGFKRKQLLPLARYQRKMGNVQDLEVLRQGWLSFLERHSMKAPHLQRFNDYLDRRRGAAVGEFLKVSDHLRRFWHDGKDS